MHIRIIIACCVVLLSSYGELWAKGILNIGDSENIDKGEKKVVNVYTSRHYELDLDLYDSFTQKTGIVVNRISGTEDEILARLEAEGDSSNMDVLFFSEVSKMSRAKQKGLLSDMSDVIDDDHIKKRVGVLYQDIDRQWVGITMRARAIVYDKTKDFPSVYSEKTKKNVKIQTYEQLGDVTGPRILVRSSQHSYNGAFVAFMISRIGEEKTSEWVRRFSGMFARSPEGNDRDQMRAIIAGVGDVALVNSYYVGVLLNSRLESDRTVGNRMSIIFPTPTHVNVSAIGIGAFSENNRESAKELIHFFMSKEVQERFTHENYEYPVVLDVEPSELLQSWGEIVLPESSYDLNVYETYLENATIIADENGWR